jgi:hypothetical protein
MLVEEAGDLLEGFPGLRRGTVTSALDVQLARRSPLQHQPSGIIPEPGYFRKPRIVSSSLPAMRRTLNRYDHDGARPAMDATICCG